MNPMHRHPKVSVVLFSAFALLSLLLLMGANYSTQVNRYRMSVIARSNFTDVYVIDTVTGVVKYLGKDEGKPFEEIKGK